MSVRVIALLTGFIPILTINITYLISSHFHHVPSCIPYLEGCSSISATGRQLPETLFFKAAIISAAILVILYWKLSAECLSLLQGERSTAMRIIEILGITGAVFLIVYVVALGYAGDQYQTQRRIGSSLFFSLTFLSELLFTRLLGKIAQGVRSHSVYPFYRWNLVLCVLLMIMGLVSIPLPVYMASPSKWENIIEWNYAVVLFLHFILNAYLWKKVGFRLNYQVETA